MSARAQRLNLHNSFVPSCGVDHLLQQPTFALSTENNFAGELSTVATNSEQGRRANIARLAAVRQRLHVDLVKTLASVRELVTLIHLARYTGAPASRAEELVLQIATSVEGLSEVASWRSDWGAVAEV